MNPKNIDAGDEPLKPLKDRDIPLIEGENPGEKQVHERQQNDAMNAGEHNRSFGEQVKHFERKIRSYNKAKDKANEGEALSSLGILYYKASKFFDARSCHERHLNIAKSLQNKRAEKRAYCNLGCTYRPHWRFRSRR